IGDANVTRPLHRLLTLSCLKFRNLFAYASSIGVGVKIRDEIGGSLDARGRLHKTLTVQDKAKLDRAETIAIKLLERAGAKHIFNSGLTCAGHVGGLLRIGAHVDKNFETAISTL